MHCRYQIKIHTRMNFAKRSTLLDISINVNFWCLPVQTHTHTHVTSNVCVIFHFYQTLNFYLSLASRFHRFSISLCSVIFYFLIHSHTHFVYSDAIQFGSVSVYGKINECKINLCFDAPKHFL